MTCDDLRRWRDGVGLSRAQAAEMVRASARAWQAWETGEREVPAWLPIVLRAAAIETAARAVLVARLFTVTRTHLGVLDVPCFVVRQPELDRLAQALGIQSPPH